MSAKSLPGVNQQLGVRGGKDHGWTVTLSKRRWKLMLLPRTISRTVAASEADTCVKVPSWLIIPGFITICLSRCPSPCARIRFKRPPHIQTWWITFSEFKHSYLIWQVGNKKKKKGRVGGCGGHRKCSGNRSKIASYSHISSFARCT